jgi:hypothetical protein
MANLATTIPDAQLEAFDVYLGGSNSSAEDRIAAIDVWLQQVVNDALWDMARSNALIAVPDPTV